MEPGAGLFIQRSGARSWEVDASTRITPQGHVVLASRLGDTGPADDPTEALTLSTQASLCADAHGTWAWPADDRRRLLAAGAKASALERLQLEADEAIIDCAVEVQGFLGILISNPEGHRLLIVDLKETYPDDEISVESSIDFIAPPRVGADLGFWIGSRSNGDLWRVHGRPPILTPRRELPAGRLEPCVGPDWVVTQAAPVSGQVVAVSGVPAAAHLSLRDDEDAVALIVISDSHWYLKLGGHRDFGAGWRLPDGVHPYSLGAVEEGRWAVLRTQATMATVLELSGDQAHAVGDPYPMPGHAGRGFTREPGGLWAHTRYLRQDAGRNRLQALAPLARRRYASAGTTVLRQVLDAGKAGSRWHRAIMEADLPPGCGVMMRVAVSDDSQAAQEWHRHRFGQIPEETEATWQRTPQASWSPTSERPFAPLACSWMPEPGRRGVFDVLLQAEGRAVRSLRGRYLHVELELIGDGSQSPCVAAMRWYPHRSPWRDRYLPELFREELSGESAAAPGPATGADFLERQLALMEAEWTPIENRIAESWRLTDPRTAPAHGLPWLASWLGMSLPRELPVDAQREMIARSGKMFRGRGTLSGLQVALDVATEQGVERGEIVVVEDFRLRRTLATVLGVELDYSDNQMLVGTHRSGNSIVGRNLILGDDQQRELQALFLGDQSPLSMADLVDRLAHRITVLVHRDADEATLESIRGVVDTHAPAHVAWRVLAASQPLMVGLTSLLGIDTSLGSDPKPEPVLVGETRVGERATVHARAILDERGDR